MIKALRRTLSTLNSNIKSAMRSHILSLLGSRASAVLVEGDKYNMLVDVADASVSRQWLRNGSYNPDEIGNVQKLLKKSDSLLILGAHIGSLAIPLSASVHSVTAFEPNPRSYELCKLNIALADAENISLYNYAVSDSDAPLNFIAAKVNSGGSKRMPIDNAGSYLRESTEVISVASIVLDEFLKDQRFTVVLADIEGGEYFAFKGAQRILSEAEVLIFEFRPHHLRDVAGVTVDEFLTTIPVSVYTHFILPRTKGEEILPISTLSGELRKIQANDSYEDNVILTSENRRSLLSSVTYFTDSAVYSQPE